METDVRDFSFQNFTSVKMFISPIDHKTLRKQKATCHTLSS